MEIDVSKCELIYNDNRCFSGQKQGIGNNCHKSDYCKYNSNCYYKQLQQYKQLCEQKTVDNFDLIKQNEELKKYIDRAGIVGIIKLLKCLDEIEEICNDSNCDNTVCEKCRFNSIDCDFDRRKAVLQKIKEVKGNE